MERSPIRPRSGSGPDDQLLGISELPPFPLLLTALSACTPALQWAADQPVGENRFDQNPHWEWKAWLMKKLEGRLGLQVDMQTTRKGRIVAARLVAGDRTDAYGCGYDDGSGVGVGCGYGNASADGYGYGDGDYEPIPNPSISLLT